MQSREQLSSPCAKVSKVTSENIGYVTLGAGNVVVHPEDQLALARMSGIYPSGNNVVTEPATRIQGNLADMVAVRQ